MPRRPATVTQADIARIIRAAKQAGAAEIIIPVGGERIVVRLTSSTEAESPLAQKHEVVL
jgi:hypothetical protein